MGGAKPLAFTEQGIALPSSVLNSDRAIEVNLTIMRTFVKMRQALIGHEEVLRKLDYLMWAQDVPKGYIQKIFNTLHQLIDLMFTDAPRRPIGVPASA